jgi:prophage regulatory protein
MTNPRLIRLPDVTGLMGLKTTAIYAEINDGVLSPPIKLGRTSLWPEHEIVAVVAARIAGHTDEEVRKLVTDLVAERPQILPDFLASRAMSTQVAA